MPPSPSGFSSLWFGPAMKPSSDIETLNRSRATVASSIAGSVHQTAQRRRNGGRRSVVPAPMSSCGSSRLTSGRRSADQPLPEPGDHHAPDHPQPLVRHRGRGSRRVLRVGVPELEDHERHPLQRGRPGRRAPCSPSTSCSTARSTPRSTAGRSSRSTRRSRCSINCADQDEVDYYWDKLSEGGEEGQCGWLKDKYGLSWQVVPGRRWGADRTIPTATGRSAR